MAKKKKLAQGNIELDMTPMIDMVFLLIIFFILAGRITSELRAEKITVPPCQTAEDSVNDPEWRHVIVEAFGTTMSTGGSMKPQNRLRWDGMPKDGCWSKELDDLTPYIELRKYMDIVYNSPEVKDYKEEGGLKLKKVIVEIRADCNTEYRVVQEIMQVLSDTIDPNKNMLPRAVLPAQMKPFVNLLFTTRNPNDKTS